MKPVLKLCWQAIRLGFSAVAGFLVWTSWLAMAIVLAVQLWLLVVKEIPVPDFLRNALRERLAASQLDATFGRTHFDPTGRILIEDVRVGTTSFSEPLITAGSIYVVLDPWALLVGGFEPREVRANGVTFHVPAMFSTTGKTEPVIGDVNLALLVRNRELEIQQFNARIGRLSLGVRGTIPIPDWRTGKKRSLPLSDSFSKQYPRLSSEIGALVARLEMFENPSLDLEVAPTGPQSVSVKASFQAGSAKLREPFVAEATALTASTTIDLGGTVPFPADLAVRVQDLRLPQDIRLQDVHAVLSGIAKPQERTFEPRDVRASASSASVPSFPVPLAPLSARLTFPLGDAPLRGSVLGRIVGVATGVEGEVDLPLRIAKVRVEGSLTQSLVDLAGQVLKQDLDPWVHLAEPIPLEANVRLDPGWVLAEADTRLSARLATYRGVLINSARTELHFAGTTLRANKALLRLGEYWASGSYEMDMVTRDYRFLLGGRLRPLEISLWFGPWWQQFFSEFEFRSTPDSDVDVQGRWGDPYGSTAFVGVSALNPVMKGVPFDRIRTSIFTRAGLIDVREAYVARGSGEANGSFVRTMDKFTGAMLSTVFSAVSTLDPQEVAKIFAPTGPSIVEPFRFAAPPRLVVSGRFDDSGAADGKHHDVRIEGTAPGAMEFMDFPLENAVFKARVVDDLIDVTRAEADVGGGHATGTVRLTGAGENQRLRFDVALKEARLGPTVAAYNVFFAKRNGTKVEEAGPYLSRAGASQLNISLTAEGSARDPLSFQGTGHADIAGPELGEIRTLGILTNLFTFSSLRFTRAQSDFRLERDHLAFPNFDVRGANSLIEAVGTYALTSKSPLDFRAKIYPVGASKGLFQGLFTWATTPLSDIFEVKLTNTLEDPQWVFVAGAEPTASPFPEPAEPPADSPSAPQ